MSDLVRSIRNQTLASATRPTRVDVVYRGELLWKKKCRVGFFLTRNQILALPSRSALESGKPRRSRKASRQQMYSVQTVQYLAGMPGGRTLGPGPCASGIRTIKIWELSLAWKNCKGVPLMYGYPSSVELWLDNMNRRLMCSRCGSHIGSL